MGLHWVLPLLDSLLPPDQASRVSTDGAVDESLDYDKPPNNGALIYDGTNGELMKDLTVSGRIVRSARILKHLSSDHLSLETDANTQTRFSPSARRRIEQSVSYLTSCLLQSAVVAVQMQYSAAVFRLHFLTQELLLRSRDSAVFAFTLNIKHYVCCCGSLLIIKCG